MTSKEALETLFASYNYNGNYQEVIEAREKLEQDLERLEILEQENQELKERIYLTHTEFEFDNLSDFRIQMRKNYIELVKLKKAFDILKDKLKFELIVYRNGGCTLKHCVNKQTMVSDDSCLRWLEIEEYELLKEVLCDDN